MVYLDNAATVPLLPEVKTAMQEAMETYFGNASALHTPGHLAHNKIEETRELLAKLINANPEEIIFTSGSTESNNTVMHIFENQVISASPYEHDSVLNSAKTYARKLQKYPVTDDANLVSIMLANNELGEIYELPHGNFYLHSDLTQALGKIPIDVRKLNLDYATFSAHKIGGPLGVGALYIRKGVPFKPLIIGGNQENKRRGGTYNTIDIIGFGAALKYVLGHKTWEQYEKKVRPLRDELAKRILEEIPGSRANTEILAHSGGYDRGLASEPRNDGREERGDKIPVLALLPNILNVSFEAAEGESIQLYLDAEEIIVSTGSACAAGDIKPSHVLMAKTHDAEVAHSSIRFSFGLNNTKEDINKVMTVLPGIIKKLQGMSTIGVKHG